MFVDFQMVETFSYELMCGLSNKIAAFGSVGGNFIIMKKDRVI